MKTTIDRYDELGKAAYDAYCQTRNWKSVRGEQLPQWTDQTWDLQQSWIAGAEAAIIHANKHCARCGEPVPGTPNFVFTMTGTLTPNPPPPEMNLIAQAHYCPECLSVYATQQTKI